jgi:hypothetical protein
MNAENDIQLFQGNSSRFKVIQGKKILQDTLKAP